MRFFRHILRQNWAIIRGTVSLWKMYENGKIAVFEEDDVDFEFFLILTVSRIIDQFGRKRYQKKRKDVSYQIL